MFTITPLFNFFLGISLHTQTNTKEPGKYPTAYSSVATPVDGEMATHSKDDYTSSQSEGYSGKLLIWLASVYRQYCRESLEPSSVSKGSTLNFK